MKKTWTILTLALISMSASYATEEESKKQVVVVAPTEEIVVGDEEEEASPSLLLDRDQTDEQGKKKGCGCGK